MGFLFVINRAIVVTEKVGVLRTTKAPITNNADNVLHLDEIRFQSYANVDLRRDKALCAFLLSKNLQGRIVWHCYKSNDFSCHCVDSGLLFHHHVWVPSQFLGLLVNTEWFVNLLCQRCSVSESVVDFRCYYGRLYSVDTTTYSMLSPWPAMPLNIFANQVFRSGNCSSLQSESSVLAVCFCWAYCKSQC